MCMHGSWPLCFTAVPFVLERRCRDYLDCRRVHWCSFFSRSACAVWWNHVTVGVYIRRRRAGWTTDVLDRRGSCRCVVDTVWPTPHEGQKDIDLCACGDLPVRIWRWNMTDALLESALRHILLTIVVHYSQCYKVAHMCINRRDSARRRLLRP